MYAKDLSKPKYEYLIKNHEYAGIKHYNDPNTFIEGFNIMDDIYENINGYNPNRKKVLIVFDNMIADIMDIMANKKFQTTVNELVIRFRKLNISLILA